MKEQNQIENPEENKSEVGESNQENNQEEEKHHENGVQNEIVNVNNNQDNQIQEENNKRIEEAQKKKNEGNDKVVLLVKEKIKKLNEYYNFCLHYEEIIHKILLTLDESTYEKITNSLDDYFNYLNFFKNSSELFSKFAGEIQNFNKFITFTQQKPKITNDFISKVMQNTQNIIYQNLSKFSIGLGQKIIAKGPLSLLKEKKLK